MSCGLHGGDRRRGQLTLVQPGAKSRFDGVGKLRLNEIQRVEPVSGLTESPVGLGRVERLVQRVFDGDEALLAQRNRVEEFFTELEWADVIGASVGNQQTKVARQLTRRLAHD